MKTLKKCILIALIAMIYIIGSLVQVSANPIDTTQAKAVAQTFYRFVANWQPTRENTCRIAYQAVASGNEVGQSRSANFSTPCFYVVTMGETGFVIVAADDCITPVLGYSTISRFDPDNVPENVSAFLENYRQEIVHCISHQIPATAAVSQKWQLLTHNESLPLSRAEVAPLIQTTWAQGTYYNNYCPADVNASTGHAVTGCVATATAQVIRYWQWPDRGINSHSYESDYGTLSVDYSAASYNYNNMPDALSYSSTAAQVHEVAALMYHCGVGVDMGYGPSESGAYTGNVPYALYNFFAYANPGEYVYRDSYTDSEWENLIKNELNNARPVIYSGSGSAGGHAFICDGYDNTDNFHINWGWGGYCDGYFTLSALNPSSYEFNSYQAAVIGVSASGTFMRCSSESMSFTAYVGSESDVQTFEVRGHDLAANVSIVAGNGFVVSADGINFQTSALLPTTGGTLYVKFIPDEIGNFSQTMTVTSGTCNETVTLFGNATEATCLPPENLTGIHTGVIVNLLWDSPVAYDNESPASTLISWDSTLAGTSSSYGADRTYCMVHRYETSDLTPYHHYQLTEISFVGSYYADSYRIVVYKGGNYNGSIFTPGEQVVNQVVPMSDINSYSWNTVILGSPIIVDASQELWIGVITYTSGNNGGSYVIRRGTNSAIAEKGNVLGLLSGENDGTGNFSWTTFSYNFPIKGKLEQISSDGLRFDVYRQDELMGSTTDSYYTDETPLNSSCQYTVSAVWNDLCSEDATVTVDPPAVPFATVTTGNVTNITSSSATCGGNVTSAGGAPVTARGVCWSTSPNPTVNGSYTTDGSGTGTFTSSITGLTPNTTYYVRAYATNSGGTNYGEQRVFTTACNTVTVEITGDTEIDFGQSATLRASGAVSYQWSDGCPYFINTVYPNTTTTYTVTGTDEYGCTGTASVTVVVEAGSITPFVSSAPSYKNVILEEYTGIYCQYCPDGHRIANQLAQSYPGRVFPINIHAGTYSSNTYTTEFGDALKDQTGLTGYPTGTVNRHVFSGDVTALNRGYWNSAAAQIMASTSPVNIAARGTLDWNTRTLNITVQLYYTANEENSTNKLNIAILQDNVLGSQTGGATYNPDQMVGDQYRHMHMLRHLITGQWGDDITTTTQGSLVQRNYTYTIPENLGTPNAIAANLEDLQFIAFVAQGQQEILTGCEVEVEIINMPELAPDLSTLTYNNEDGCSSDAEITASVRNLGSTDLSSLTFEYSVANSATMTYNWTGNIPSLSNEAIALPTFGITPNIDQLISVRIVNVNGQPFDGDNVTITIKKNLVIEEGPMVLEIMTDSWGSETSFYLYDESNTVVQQSSSFSNSTLHTFDLNLPTAGCYRLEVLDSYGDGITSGYVRISSGTTQLFNATGSSFSTKLVVNLSSSIPPVVVPVEVSICENDLPYHYVNGDIDTTFDVGTANHSVFNFPFTSEYGGDSTVVLTVNINTVSESELTVAACSSFSWQDYTNLTESGDYTVNLENAAGCDSIVTLHLTINQPTEGDTTVVACGSFSWHGYTNLTEGGDYTDVLTNAAGCDSTVTLHLTINQPVVTEMEEAACNVFEWQGETLTSSGDYTAVFTAANGCDSTVILHLTINASDTIDLYEQVCIGEIYTQNGFNVSESGDYQQNLTNAMGCDSIVRLHLTVTEAIETEVTGQVCLNGQYTEYGFDIFAGEAGDFEYSVTIPRPGTCDSIVTLHLTVSVPTEGDTTAVACGSFSWHGYTNLTESGDYTDVLTNAAGCDSTVTLHLTVNQPISVEISATACSSYSWNDSIYTETGDYVQTFTGSNGCDSSVTLHLTVITINTEIEYATTPELDAGTLFVVQDNAEYQWIDCVTNEPIEGETRHWFNPAVSGSYACIITLGECADTTECVDISVGVEEWSNGSLTLYPNPTTGMVNVQCTMNSGQWMGGEIQVLDVYGRLLDVVAVETVHAPSLQTTTIDLSRYATGVYIIKWVNDGRVVTTGKVVKE